MKIPLVEKIPKCYEKYLYLFLFITLFISTVERCSFAENNFYQGRKQTNKVFRWQRKCTKNFCVMYKDKYINPEKILEELSQKFGIKPRISGIKIKVFIQKGPAYIKPGLKRIYVWDELELRHELTHLLFYQLNRNAPFSIREGIAVYAEYSQNLPYVPEVEAGEIAKLEKDFKKISNSSKSKGIYNRRAKKALESKLYSQGFCFVANLIKKRGIEDFKKFYKKCKGFYNIKRTWQDIYSKKVSHPYLGR